MAAFVGVGVFEAAVAVGKVAVPVVSNADAVVGAAVVAVGKAAEVDRGGTVLKIVN